jgi:hypothetical protein
MTADLGLERKRKAARRRVAEMRVVAAYSVIRAPCGAKTLAMLNASRNSIATASVAFTETKSERNYD